MLLVISSPLADRLRNVNFFDPINFFVLFSLNSRFNFLMLTQDTEVIWFTLFTGRVVQ